MRSCLLAALFNLFNNNTAQSRKGDEITYSEFLSAVEAGNVTDATISGHRISGSRKEGGTFQTYSPDDPGLVERLEKKNVKFKVRAARRGRSLDPEPAVELVPDAAADRGLDLLHAPDAVGIRPGHGLRQVASAKLLTERHGRVTFEDVAGVDEAKSDLQEIVEFLRDPQKFQRLGGRIPRGCLLVGPPGTGKTLIARAVAGEANVPFFTISGSDFVEMFVGVGASRVRDMFEQAKKNAPCIIFIDEIDAVGRHRGAGLGGGNDEREQTLNQLLVEMDGFEANEGIIIIAATNRPDVLDPALLRPGRFDRQIVVPNPGRHRAREDPARAHAQGAARSRRRSARDRARHAWAFPAPISPTSSTKRRLLAARRNKRLVTQAEFEDAKDKVMMGAERRSMAMTEEEKLATAYHEAGHAIVNVLVPGNDPLHKVTIIPRGRALGVTMSLPEARQAQLLDGMVRRQDRDGVRRPRCRADHLRQGAPQHRALRATSRRRPASPGAW